MSLPDVPGVAQAAIQSGRFAARTISDRVGGKQPTCAFRYHDKGSLATIAKARAVACLGRVKLSGTPAWLVWLGVHLFTLNGYRNRVTVTVHWSLTFLGNARSERASTTRQANRACPPAQIVSASAADSRRIVAAASSPPTVNSVAQR
jgi:NADH dehydrogenase